MPTELRLPRFASTMRRSLTGRVRCAPIVSIGSLRAVIRDNARGSFNSQLRAGSFSSKSKMARCSRHAEQRREPIAVFPRHSMCVDQTDMSEIAERDREHVGHARAEVALARRFFAGA